MYDDTSLAVALGRLMPGTDPGKTRLRGVRSLLCDPKERTNRRAGLIGFYARHFYTETTPPFPVSKRAYDDTARGPLIGMGGISAGVHQALPSEPHKAPASFACPVQPFARPDAPVNQVSSEIEQMLASAA